MDNFKLYDVLNSLMLINLNVGTPATPISVSTLPAVIPEIPSGTRNKARSTQEVRIAILLAIFCCCAIPAIKNCKSNEFLCLERA